MIVIKQPAALPLPRPQSLLCEEHHALLLEKGRRVGRLREAEAVWITRGWRDAGGRVTKDGWG